jgi:uncharacterized protein YijF (DUF1287 family)
LVLTKQKVQYDPSYFRIPYPNGDIPANKGVCTDVIIRAYFSRHGTAKETTSHPKDYQPGDIVCWNLGGGIKHIGMVVNKKSADGTHRAYARTRA